MEIRFTHAPDDSDIKAAASLVTKRFSERVNAAAIFLLLLFGSLLLTHFYSFIDSHSVIRPVLYILLGAAVWHMFILLSYPVPMEKDWKAVPGFSSASSYRISNEGIEVESPCCHSNLSWSHFQSFVELKEHFFLMKGPNPCNWIPKRLISEAEQESLRQLLKEKLPMK